jgi:hypothetical protein
LIIGPRPRCMLLKWGWVDWKKVLKSMVLDSLVDFNILLIRILQFLIREDK